MFEIARLLKRQPLTPIETISHPLQRETRLRVYRENSTNMRVNCLLRFKNDRRDTSALINRHGCNACYSHV